MIRRSTRAPDKVVGVPRWIYEGNEGIRLG